MNAIVAKIEAIAENRDHNRKVAQKVGRGAYSVFRFLLLFGVGFIILYPILYMFSMAIRPGEQVYDAAVIWIPKTLTADNIIRAATEMEYGKSFFVTAGLVLMSTVLQCLSCSLVGYGFAKFKFKGRNLLFALVLFTLVVPAQTITLSLFVNYTQFDWFGIGQLGRLFGGEAWITPLLNTIWPHFIATISASGIRAGLFIYMFRSYYAGLPIELEDAAYIDGSGFFGTYLRVMWPNAGPITLVTFLLTFVWYWNDYTQSAMILNEFNLMSVEFSQLQSSLSSVLSPGSAEMTITMQAACLIYVLPILIMYIILQRKFTESIVKSGIVG
ncbi:MAG: carbohydrate ABC transporter permease [Clostridia bacterium]|nr:carbohydrate ABC transporter permease [Clostridia bacterium]